MNSIDSKVGAVDDRFSDATVILVDDGGYPPSTIAADVALPCRRILQRPIVPAVYSSSYLRDWLTTLDVCLNPRSGRVPPQERIMMIGHGRFEDSRWRKIGYVRRPSSLFGLAFDVFLNFRFSSYP